jgi:HD-GYP domain-containing protein (c-di-GMP phosphodiesterase class II)
MLELKDPFTSGHELRVADLSVQLANKLGLTPEEKFIIDIAARVHDIGKFWIPSEILTRPGPLLPVQFEIVKMHTKIGFKVMQSINFPWQIETIVLQHHERLDGSGYPNGLKCEEILFESKLIAIADVVESVFSHRPYRPALGLDFALEVIHDGKGTLYDPCLVDICTELFVKDGYKFPEIKHTDYL